MRRWSIRIAAIVFVLIIIGTADFVVYWSNPIPPGANALKAMQSTPSVTVRDQANEIIFMPQSPPKVGFIFYQGARVAPAAYAVTMHAIAEKGYAVFIPKMPLNMALLGINSADGIIAANPTIKVWVIGGHSLGGVAASAFVGASTNKSVKALILFASYPASSITANTNLTVVSISASNDGLATPDKIKSNKSLLPASTQYDVIQGGNHAQFGDYGLQDGDTPATISPQEQTAQVVDICISLLNQLADSLLVETGVPQSDVTADIYRI